MKNSKLLGATLAMPLSLGCGFDPTLVVTCDDGVRNGAEADVDCGGVCPTLCAEGSTCAAGADCASLRCVDGACQAPSCDDGVKNAAEVDVDCGVTCSAPCADHKLCAMPGDCQSNVCTGGRCMPSTCGDGVLGAGETDLDCGGPCQPCDNGKSCTVGQDCASGACVGGICSIWVSDVGPVRGEATGGARAVDADGNLFAAGTFSGIVSVGGSPLDGTSGKNVFLAKYTPVGVHLWSNNVGPGYAQGNAQSASFDASGNVVIAGWTDAGGNFGGDDLPRGMFVAKYSGAGDHLWSRVYDAPGGNAGAPSLAVLPNGDVVVGGSFSAATFVLGGTTLTSTVLPYPAPYAVRLSASDGSVVWARAPAFPSTGSAGGNARAIAVDPAGDIIAVGGVGGTLVDFGCGGEPKTLGDVEAFVVKLDGGTGACKWARIDQTTQGPVGKIALAVVVDPSGNLLVAGWQSFGVEAVYLEKYAGADGSLVWATAPVADVRPELAFRMTLDAAGNVLVAGMYRGGAPDFGGGPLINAGTATSDVFLAQFAAADGAHLHSRRYGGMGDDLTVGLGVSPTGGVVLMGLFQQSVDFGTGALVAESPFSAFFLGMGSLSGGMP